MAKKPFPFSVCEECCVAGGGGGGGGEISIDTEMSDTSENPVQNKVIKSYIDGIADDLELDCDIKPNLFDFKKVMTGYLSSNGSMSNMTSNEEITSDFIEIVPNVKYNIQVWIPKNNDVQPWIRVCYYDENCSFLSQTTFSAVNDINIIETITDGGKHHIAKLTTPSNCKYIKFSTRAKENVLIKVEEGWESTPYCEYVEIDFNKGKISDYDHILKSINHRGLNTVAPEETASAYKASAKVGFRYVECDIKWTLDGVPVLSHDDSIDRTSNGTGLIKEKTLDELKALDFGSWFSPKYAGEKILTFDEFMKLCKMLGLHPYIEIVGGYAPSDWKEKLFGIIDKYDMRANSIICSSSETMLDMVIEYDSDISICQFLYSVDSAIIERCLTRKKLAKDYRIAISTSVLSDANVELIRSAKLPLEVFILDTWYNISNLHPYVSGVITEGTNCGKARYHSALKNL